MDTDGALPIQVGTCRPPDLAARSLGDGSLGGKHHFVGRSPEEIDGSCRDRGVELLSHRLSRFGGLGDHYLTLSVVLSAS